jgi:hypothetical protein
MKKFLEYAVLTFIMAFWASSIAGAQANHKPPTPPPPPPKTKPAPEVDPGMAASGLSLLFGTLAVLRGRNRKLLVK